MTPTHTQLQQAVIDAVPELVRATCNVAFCAPLQGTVPPLYLALGEPH